MVFDMAVGKIQIKINKLQYFIKIVDKENLEFIKDSVNLCCTEFLKGKI